MGDGCAALHSTPFARQADRRLERALIAEYEQDMRVLLGAGGLDRMIARAVLPGEIRGFGPVKAAGAAVARQKRDVLMDSQVRAMAAE